METFYNIVAWTDLILAITMWIVIIIRGRLKPETFRKYEKYTRVYCHSVLVFVCLTILLIAIVALITEVR